MSPSFVGHPDHDLLFVATQVARAAGLKAPGTAIQSFHSSPVGFETKLNDIRAGIAKNTIRGHVVQSRSWLFSESRVYAMLLRGHSKASEPFRKWVTEEVLPSIRKTGKYNAEQSSSPIAQSVMDALKAIEGRIEGSAG